MNNEMNGYLQKLLYSRNSFFSEMEEYAKDNGVPIMEPIGMEVLLQLLRLHQPKSILEVGAAIGYSALRMADALPDARIVTIERDEDRIALAKQYFASAESSDRITLLEGDALETAKAAGAFGPFDAIFIDAAKGQYKRFFELYEPYLQPAGVIIVDNVLFKGLVAQDIEKIEPRRIRSLVRKINEFNTWLVSNPKYDTTILPLGDGVAISKRRGEQ
ncbi:O-methyltransferase [Peribacillus saganii]|uniref:tRNA 5-hydroxyuridine methyltransferase n=1 Tax=Peribacillus saganii TaxID=2303992 RepID=A0A372LTV3_9BACI|nr:O-methyltransferase [Peribacillus saganii]RFU71631.1 O-methyltransferase [Peribacillus saganii]